MNSVLCMVVDQAWKIVMKDHQYDLVELQRLHLAENLSSIRKEKNSMWKFGSLIVCIFFYIQKHFPGVSDIVWEQDKLVFGHVNEYITQLGENFENVMDAYFEEFKKRMKMKMMILEELVTRYYSNIFYIVDI